MKALIISGPHKGNITLDFPEGLYWYEAWIRRDSFRPVVQPKVMFAKPDYIEVARYRIREIKGSNPDKTYLVGLHDSDPRDPVDAYLEYSFQVLIGEADSV